MNKIPLSLEQISILGEKIYSEKLKEILEKSHNGQYAVIDVETSDYEVDADRLVAINKATEKFGQKLFYIIQIGNSSTTSVNFSAKKYAWDF